MTRVLILLLLVAAVWWMIRGERRAALRRREAAAAAKAPPEARIDRERIVACTQCDLHLPVSQAIAERVIPGGGADTSNTGGGGRAGLNSNRVGTAGGSDAVVHWFCSEAHRVLYEASVVGRGPQGARARGNARADERGDEADR